MSIFLIDYENVGVPGLDGLTKLHENDIIYIFYSENADRLTFGLHKRLSECKAQIIYMKIGVGSKNALDFQLASFLGYLIGEKPEGKFYIVSKDKGFECLSKFWEKRKIKVDCVVSLTGKNIEEEINDLELSLVNVIDPKYLKMVTGFLQKYKTKQGVNNALVKELGTTKAGELYKLLKPYMNDKKGV